MFRFFSPKKFAVAMTACLSLMSQADARQGGLSIKHLNSEVRAGDCVFTTFELFSAELMKNVKISLAFINERGVKVATGTLELKKIGSPDAWFYSPDATKTVNLREEYVMPDEQYCLPPTTVKVIAATALVDGKMVDLVAQKMISENTYQFVPMKIKIGK